MARNNRFSVLTDLEYLSTGETTKEFTVPSYPYLFWHNDTWRKKVFYNEFMREYNQGNEEASIQVIKKVWCEHNTTCRGKLRRMLSLDILLAKCFDNCPCCNNELWYGRCYNSLEFKKSRDNKPSIDKLAPDGEYTDDNTWVICTTCNTHKNNAVNPDRLRIIANAWEKQINK
jgi:hypothetical protein